MISAKMSAPIIITVPNNYLAVEEMESKVVVDVAHTPSRKRRLDHLTWEEKMQRKKLKNRVAAQTSRDRKKAKMDEMESRINQCMEMNKRLVSEVENLKAVNERLLSENAELRNATARAVGGAPRPAVSYPQQKEGPPPATSAVRTLLALLTLSQTCSSTSTPLSTSTPFMNLPTHCSKKLLEIVQERINMKTGIIPKTIKEDKWWGPQQSNWNPVKVES